MMVAVFVPARKTRGTATTYFLYDGSIPVVELNATGAVTVVNTFGAIGVVSSWTITAGSTFYQFATRKATS